MDYIEHMEDTKYKPDKYFDTFKESMLYFGGLEIEAKEKVQLVKGIDDLTHFTTTKFEPENIKDSVRLLAKFLENSNPPAHIRKYIQTNINESIVKLKDSDLDGLYISLENDSSEAA